MTTKPFDRYEGAPATKDRRMPQTRLSASTSPRTVGELIGKLEEFTASDKIRKMYPWTERFVMGIPLPPWQRPVTWNLDQMVKFITSLWEDVDVGSYLVNDVVEFVPRQDQELEAIPLSDVLLDGQQRLTALERYLLNEFPVPDANGVPTYWRELGKVERRFFTLKLFPMSYVRSWDEAELRHIYNLRAFGGTPHTEDQRA